MLACSQNIEGIPKRSTSGGLRESWVPHQSLMEFSWIPNGIAMPYGRGIGASIGEAVSIALRQSSASCRTAFGPISHLATWL